MWRGTLYSTLLHGGIVLAIVAGIPVLPSIFDRERELETDGAEQSISIEIVSADSIDLRQNVVAADKAPDERPKPAAIAESLPPARLSPTKPTPLSDTPPVPNPEPKTRSAKTQIPEGALNRPQSAQTSRIRPAPVQRRQVETPRKPKPSQQTEPPVPRAVDVKSAAAPQAAARKTSREPRNDKIQDSQQSQSASAPVKPRPDTPNSVSSSAQRPAAPAAAAAADIDKNEFIRAVRGEKRELVRQVLEADNRTRQAVVPRPASVKITEQARERTLQRLQKATAKGYPHAQYNLAGKYLRGEDVSKDPEEALKLLSGAAQKGYVPAQSLLALLRFTGFGVPQDQAEAAFWWSLAADGGDDGAKIAVDLIQKQLKPRELVKSKRLRARWGSLITDLAELTTGKTNRRDLDSELRDASEKGDLDAVLSLLASGADADEAGDEGRNAVINAAWRGRERIINLLLERGVATELPDDGGRTPLMWAAINGHIDIVQKLVASGANPNHTDRDGGTALIRASWNGHTDAVRSLIGAGADVNVRDGNGLTALDHARREGNTTIVNALRAAGAR